MSQTNLPVDRAAVALHDKLDRLLAKAKPTRRELTLQRFRDLYPRLESHLAGGRLLKDVLAAFNELTQSKVCARTFNDMLDEERVRRNDAGDSVRCAACGRPLKEANEASHFTVGGSTNESQEPLPTEGSN